MQSTVHKSVFRLQLRPLLDGNFRKCNYGKKQTQNLSWSLG